MYNNPNYIYERRPMEQNNRFIGGFAAPFLLGGLTGGLLAPAFYPRPMPFPPYPPYPYPPRPYSTYNQTYYY